MHDHGCVGNSLFPGRTLAPSPAQAEQPASWAEPGGGEGFLPPGPGWRAGTSCGSLPGVLAHAAPKGVASILGTQGAWGPSGREGPRMTRGHRPSLGRGPYDSPEKVATFQPETSEPPIWCRQLPPALEREEPASSTTCTVKRWTSPSTHPPRPPPVHQHLLGAWGCLVTPYPRPGLAELGGLHNSDSL